MTNEEISIPKIQERLYSYNPSNYCGVFMPEKVMKKLVKLTASFEEEVRRVLLDNIDDLYTYEWRLAYPNGKQTTIYFGNKDGDMKHRISLFQARQPEYHPDVYLGSGYTKEVETFIKSFGENPYDKKEETETPLPEGEIE